MQQRQRMSAGRRTDGFSEHFIPAPRKSQIRRAYFNKSPVRHAGGVQISSGAPSVRRGGQAMALRPAAAYRAGEFSHLA
jgi:hypothetical protein